MKKYILLFVLPILLLSVDANGQVQNRKYNFAETHTRFKIRRTISLNGDSQKDTVVLKIEKQTSVLELQIISRVSLGELTIEIYNPAGEKEGNYSVGSQIKADRIKSLNGSDNKGKQETVHGEINRELIGPMVGDWKIAVIPSTAKGDVIIISTHFIKE